MSDKERAEKLQYIADSWNKLSVPNRLELFLAIVSVLKDEHGKPETIDGALLRIDGGKRVD